MSAGCTRLQQRNNNVPATIQPAAEAELTQGAERTKKTKKKNKNKGTNKNEKKERSISKSSLQIRSLELSVWTSDAHHALILFEREKYNNTLHIQRVCRKLGKRSIPAKSLWHCVQKQR
jgi:hypothetical protein